MAETVKILQAPQAGLSDMAKLQDLNVESILENIRQRFEADQIYTYIGSILAAVNPYKTIPNLYDFEVMEAYDKRHIGDLPPHIYAIANDAYYSMWKQTANQCVLISGESGAGKTESTKFILNYLSKMSQASAVETGNDVSVEKCILQSSPILEAFGNAKTVYNNNSSRFGKFIQLAFSSRGVIEGGKVQDYLLEKNRVVGQNPGERNYHIFYALILGAPDEMKQKLGLGAPEKYKYINQSGCIKDPNINDQQIYSDVNEALKDMKLNDEQVSDMFELLGAILHIGNLDFITAGGAQVSSMSVLKQAADLLSVDEYQLANALTEKTRLLRGELISTPLDEHQARDSRDSLAMNLYARCFHWIISRINVRIRTKPTFHSVGVLDIFGFENFEVNRFEQFNINFANEKLQEYFNKHIFSLEQHEYNAEGLDWVDIDWQDNGECLDLIVRKLGLLSLIDEESRFPKGTDGTMLDKLHSNHAKNGFYIKPRVNNSKFGIKHYAGDVFYETTGFLEKNRDTFRDEMLTTIKESRSDFIYDLFEDMQESSQPNAAKKNRKKPTVSSQFQESLHSLMSTLSACNPYFVRCIKPNSTKAPNAFEKTLTLNQLRYSGMLETVKIRRAGFPVRRLFDDFVRRYRPLLGKDTQSSHSQHKCISLLSSYESTNQKWQIGRTKVFLKEDLEIKLERDRAERVETLVTKAKACFKGYRARKAYKATVAKIVFVQKYCRMYRQRRRFLNLKDATITLQRYERGRKARQLFHVMMEERRMEEERKREEQRRRAEEEQRELERLKAEAKLRELEELQAKLEEDARIKAEEEAAKKKREEEERQRVLEKAKAIEAAKRLEEEQAKIRAEEERLKLENELRIRREEEALRLEKEEAERLVEEKRLEEEVRRREEELAYAMQQVMTHFDDSIAQFEEADQDSEYQDDDPDEDSVSRKSDDLQYWEGYLNMKCGGMVNTWKKRYCVLRDETLMWFRAKQEALKSGWLMKKGGGTSTLSRRNWRKRFFVLKGIELAYYESDSDGAPCKGIINIKQTKDILDSSFGRESSLDIITDKRTYHIVADNADDLSEWFSILMRVKNANEYELKQMQDEDANPKNAIGTLDVAVIDSVVPVHLQTKPNAFAIITAERVFNMSADSPEDMNGWLKALTQYHKGQRTYSKEEILMSGWLTKENTGTISRPGITRKKRYFILTSHSLDIYKSVDLQHKLGAIALNRLCSVTVPDDKMFKEIDYPPELVIMNGNRRSPPSGNPETNRRSSFSFGRKSSISGLATLSRPRSNSRPYVRDYDLPLPTNSPVASPTMRRRKLSWGKKSKIKMDLRTAMFQGGRRHTWSSKMMRNLFRCYPRSKPWWLHDLRTWKFTIHSRRYSYNLFTPSNDEAWKWTYAIQEVIDSKPPIETPSQILIKELREASLNGYNDEIDKIYKLNPILRNVPYMLKSPLLPLPYGQIMSSNLDKGYTTLQDEAVKIFNVLQGSEQLPDPMPVIQGILQTCQDLKPLQDEVYCQLVKQTTWVKDADNLNNLRNWQILCCMCCTFIPSRSILRYVRFHIKRQVELSPKTQMAAYAGYALEALKRTRTREFVPSRDEIIAILGRRDMNATVFCHGGGSCQISINSSTTAGQVIHTLVKGMNLDSCYNRFSLYEKSGLVEKAIDDRSVVADILAKFESLNAQNDDGNKDSRFRARGLSDRGKPWQLFFKLFCFLDTQSVKPDSIEYSFLFEQAHEEVIRGKFPATDEQLIHLSALRMQFDKGDYVHGDWINDLTEVYPVDRLKVKPKEDNDFGFQQRDRKDTFISGTLRGIGEKTLKRLQKSASDDNILESVYRDDVSATITAIIDKWRTLKGTSAERAQNIYMSFMRSWKYFGSRLFEVECHDGRQAYPKSIWLSVNKSMVAVHKINDPNPLDEFPYEKILSFGAPIPNEYKIIVEGRRSELTFDTTEVFEIAKLMKAYINEIVKKRNMIPA
ncbi:unconventional myosin-X-like isoform X3 [Antedon mediterranea]|uniref:unconventional myosin-X-like isoform X3 n=1 Tax=Antedon mediterranea TaxID=105859 RepID=UPI003AF57EB9